MSKLKTMCKPKVAGSIIPIPGKIGPDGAPAVMPFSGMAVDLSQAYWRNRLRDGSIVRVAPEPKPKAKTAAKKGGE